MRQLLVMLCLLLPATAVSADAVQPLPSIEAAVSEFVSATLDTDADLEFHIGRLDPRLRLPLCDIPLGARNPRNTLNNGPMSVEVRCTGSKPWVLYVAVSVSRYAEVAVTRRPLARDTLITVDDLKLERREVDNRHAGYLTDVDSIVGQMSSRALRSGQIITADQLKRPRLVRRGDQVTLTIGTSAVRVRTRGEALEDGAAGERIGVLNLSSERVVEGEVISAGEVVVRVGAVL